MGIRIEYYSTNTGKTIVETLTENYVRFRHWYLKREDNSLSEFNESIGNQSFVKFLENNPTLNLDTTPQQIIDELFAEFIIDDYQSDSIKIMDGHLSKWRYKQSTELINESNDRELINYWNTIINGRSLVKDRDYHGLSNDYKMGYLTVKEQKGMKFLIEKHFGTLKEMKEKYWTKTEKKQWQKSQNDKNYYPKNHNPKSSGIELILNALTTIENKNRELIIGIEQEPFDKELDGL